MVEGEGRLGRKNGKGFYDYPESGPKRLWPGLKDLQPTQLDPDTLDVAELKQRLLVTQALEAARTVEEGVSPIRARPMSARSSASASRPYTGGALSYIDCMGAKAFVALCERLQAKHGDRFAAPKIIRDMAASGGTFYGRAEARKAA